MNKGQNEWAAAAALERGGEKKRAFWISFS